MATTASPLPVVPIPLTTAPLSYSANLMSSSHAPAASGSGSGPAPGTYDYHPQRHLDGATGTNQYGHGYGGISGAGAQYRSPVPQQYSAHLASYNHPSSSSSNMAMSTSISPQPTISIDRQRSGSSSSYTPQYQSPIASPHPGASSSASASASASRQHLHHQPHSNPHSPSPGAYNPDVYGSSASGSASVAVGASANAYTNHFYSSPSPAPTTKFTSPPPHQPSPTKFQSGHAQMDGGSSAGWNQAQGQSQQAGPSTYRQPSATLEKQDRRVSEVARVEYEDGRVGTEDPFGERSYTEVKCLGDGSFGTVWLCDWLSPVRSDTYLSAMQCGAGARTEWSGKRLVALKRMKRVWEGGWSQAKNLGELASLRLIPPHDNIIPLYDAFISPKSRELYFVFECMEGNLYQLTKSRKGRPLAAGLIASCFHQISAGLYHIHRHGYFHRDMKPENLLVTTTGLTDYLTANTLNAINAARSASPDQRIPPDVEMRYEKDVSVIVKLADFGLARETKSKPPYTEYVSTRWYRAPEVLLRSREYGPPVDMWALGTILAEMVNLKPLFPGVSEIDQVYRICGTMGDPSAEYGHDERGKTVGGGSWNTGIKLAKNVGFSFPKRTPVHFRSLFNENVPQSLVDCILDLLRYNPRYRLTSAECIEHPYFHETLPHLRQTPPIPRVPFSQGQPAPGVLQQHQAQSIEAPPRQIPPSHSHQAMPQPPARPAFADGDMRTLPPPIGTPDGAHAAHGKLFFPSHGGSDGRVYGASALVNQLRELDLPTEDLSSYGNRPPPMEGERRWEGGRQPSSVYNGSNYDGTASTASVQQPQPPSMSSLQLTDGPRDRPTRPSKQDVAKYVQDQQYYYDNSTPRQGGSGTIPTPPPIEAIEPHGARMAPPAIAAVGKKKKWGLSSVFGSSEKHLPSGVEDTSGYTGSANLKRTQSGTPANVRVPVDPATITDPKKAKKEAERQAREAEKAKRELLVAQQKERARAVMRKRHQEIQDRVANHENPDFDAQTPGVFEVSKLASGSSNLSALARGSNLNLGSTAQLAASAVASSSRVSLTSSHHDQPGTQSVTSFRSGSTANPQSLPPPAPSHDQLSMATLAARDRMEMEKDPIYSARHKSRRRDDDADHSRSSLDVNSLKSRSALTIGTVDSDPGPRRLNLDPLLEAQSRRHASHSNYKSSPRSASKSRLMSGSNPSQDSQLAHDFRVHANVTSSSSTSLGRHGQSSMSLHDVPPVPQTYAHHPATGQTEMGWNQGQGSAPTSPYGHPKGTAVAMGQGIGRDYVQQGLPPISDWEGQGMINPMFRVPPAQTQATHPGAGQTTTLPPFSTLASVADQQRPNQAYQR